MKKYLALLAVMFFYQYLYAAEEGGASRGRFNGSICTLLKKCFCCCLKQSNSEYLISNDLNDQETSENLFAPPPNNPPQPSTKKTNLDSLLSPDSNTIINDYRHSDLNANTDQELSTSFPPCHSSISPGNPTNTSSSNISETLGEYSEIKVINGQNVKMRKKTKTSNYYNMNPHEDKILKNFNQSLLSEDSSNSTYKEIKTHIETEKILQKKIDYD